ncbi:MAG TPA: glycosyltransferase family 4 protein [Pyrinomonadaceae bacterium]|nr:glycosyltransferase family 4 protein [Pyrinomonadaceae bacterium]
MLRVGILLTHPTQYHSPWFQELAKRPQIEIKVFYCFQPDSQQQGLDFDVPFEWDIPLLDGYPSSFLKNVARSPGFNFFGCDTPEIRRIIASREFDAWIINGWKVKSDWQAMTSCWKNRIPMLIRGDSNLLDHKTLHLRAAKRLVLGRWIPRFNRYLTVGKLNEDFYEFYGANPSRFFPVRHFVDNDRFAQQATSARTRAAELKSKWGIPAGAVVFLFAGKFIDKKRPMDALLAIERVNAKGLKVHLLMTGDGKLRSELEEYTRRNQLPVSFSGFLNQEAIAEAYACANVLLLPSGYAETWGLVVNEAMSCGIPAIVSDRVGCGPDLVKHGKTGFIFPVGNIETLAEAVTLYAKDLSLAKSHGENARQQIQNYSIGAAVDGSVAALESMELSK